MVYNLLVQNNSFEIGLPGSFSQLHHFLVVGPQYCYLTLCLDSSFEKKKGNNCIPLLGLWHGINTGSMLRTRGHYCVNCSWKSFPAVLICYSFCHMFSTFHLRFLSTPARLFSDISYLCTGLSQRRWKEFWLTLIHKPGFLFSPIHTYWWTDVRQWLREAFSGTQISWLCVTLHYQAHMLVL